MHTDPFPTWPAFTPAEINAVTETLESLEQDSVCSFENEFAAYCQLPFALSTNSGTTALELAIRCLGLRPGGEVIVPARGYFAVAGAVMLCGGTPVFCDVGLETHNLDPALLHTLLTPNTQGIICIHLGGSPCDMDALVAFAKANDLFLVEDCAQAHGATYRDKPVGSFGDAAIFSFTGDKIISTLEGGMLVTSTEAIYRHAWSYRENGKDAGSQGYGTDYRYLRSGLGSNFRLSALHAALGRMQLSRVGDLLARRRRNAQWLQRALASDGKLGFQSVQKHATSSFYRCYVHARNESQATGILDRARMAGAPISRGACPEIYREPVFAGRGLTPPNPLQNAQRLGQTSVAVAVNPMLKESHLERLAALITGP